MRHSTPIRDHLFNALAPALAFCALVYFGYHALEGRHGLLALRAYEQAIPDLESDAQRLAERRARLTKHIALLDPHHVDPDLLEELARARLGFVHPDDVIVPLPELPEH